MSRGEGAILDGNGKQWGVMFLSDRSVEARWSGRNQRVRAREELARVRLEYTREQFALVWRYPGQAWVESTTVVTDHLFDPGWSGQSTECNHLVMRDGGGDTCNKPREWHTDVPAGTGGATEKKEQ